jgi:hypothetical protein
MILNQDKLDLIFSNKVSFDELLKEEKEDG